MAEIRRSPLVDTHPYNDWGQRLGHFHFCSAWIKASKLLRFGPVYSMRVPQMYRDVFCSIVLAMLRMNNGSRQLYIHSRKYSMGVQYLSLANEIFPPTLIQIQGTHKPSIGSMGLVEFDPYIFTTKNPSTNSWIGHR